MKQLQKDILAIEDVAFTCIKSVFCLALLLPMSLLPTSWRKAIDGYFPDEKEWY